MRARQKSTAHTIDWRCDAGLVRPATVFVDHLRVGAASLALVGGRNYVQTGTLPVRVKFFVVAAMHGPAACAAFWSGTGSSFCATMYQHRERLRIRGSAGGLVVLRWVALLYLQVNHAATRTPRGRSAADQSLPCGGTSSRAIAHPLHPAASSLAAASARDLEAIT